MTEDEQFAQRSFDEYLTAARHRSDRIILVGIDNEARATCQPHVRQHVATGERGDERFFRIDSVRI